MNSVHFQGKPFNIMVIQVYAPNRNAEEAEVEQFYEDLQDLLELTPPKDVLFIIEDWNAKVGSQETPGSEVKSEVAQSCPTLCDPMDCSLPGSSVQGFSRQEYWSGVPLPSPIKGVAISTLIILLLITLSLPLQISISYIVYIFSGHFIFTYFLSP